MPPVKAAVVALTAKLCAHAHDAGVQAACCDILSCLPDDDEDDDDVDDAAAADALNAVVGALRQHVHHADLAKARLSCSCAADAAARCGARQQSYCDLRDAAPALVAALRAHSGDAEVQAYCCCVLRYITRRRPRNLLKAGAAGANEAVVAAMRANGDVRLQVEGCFALGVMCQDDNAAHQVKAGAAGGVEAVLAALRAFPAIADVTEIALFALDALVHHNATNQRTAGAAGAVEAVLGCMRGAHIADANVQDNACMALGGLIKCDDHPNLNLRAAHASGALDAVAAVMRAVSAADEDASPSSGFRVSKNAVQDSACCALRFLIDDSDEQHKREAVRAGVLEALQRQEANPGALEDGRLELIAELQPVAARHDDAASSGGCAHYPSCQRCAHLRATCKLCALPGCGARNRRDGSGKTLLRCGRCGAACYCGAGHQREDWARHKLECARPEDDDTA
jgi:hypothetical protein